ARAGVVRTRRSRIADLGYVRGRQERAPPLRVVVVEVSLGVGVQAALALGEGLVAPGGKPTSVLGASAGWPTQAVNASDRSRSFAVRNGRLRSAFRNKNEQVSVRHSRRPQ